MHLLPIIIVVSLLAFFIALTLVILAWRAFTAAERRKNRRTTRSRKDPVRQLTIQNGKLVPFPHNLGKQEFNSADLSTVRTGESDKSLDKPRRIPSTLIPLDPKANLFGPRDSSPPSDLEAQTSIDPNKFEENLKTLQLLNKRLLEDPQNRVMPRRAEQGRRWHGDDRNAVHSRKITESLQKAYDFQSFPSRQVSQVPDSPVSPKSKPMPSYLRRPDRTSGISDPAHRRSSKATSDSIQHRIHSIGEQLNALPHANLRQSAERSFSLPADSPTDAIQAVPAVRVRPPAAAIEVGSSQGRSDSFDARNLTSTFSTHTTKTRNSRTSSAPHSISNSKRASTVPIIPPLKLPVAIKLPPPTPVTTTSNLEKAETTDVLKPLRPSPTRIKFQSGAKSEARHPRPPDIDVAIANAAQKPSSPFLESLPATPETQIYVGQSARSTRSFATFASSDLSSIWTFGKAQRVPIFPSVAPKAIGVEETGNHVAPLRPKSKYGRKVKATGMKALPVLPNSPMSREEMV
ncbi:MAG: hypothetical protein Q9196_002144 [Gyalolechia fulgens]